MFSVYRLERETDNYLSIGGPVTEIVIVSVHKYSVIMLACTSRDSRETLPPQYVFIITVLLSYDIVLYLLF